MNIYYCLWCKKILECTRVLREPHIQKKPECYEGRFSNKRKKVAKK